MSIYGKKTWDYVRFVRLGIILILIMGLIRFVVGISGIPYEKATHFVSLTILTSLLFVIYGHRAAAANFGTYIHLLPLAFALAVTMYGFIVMAILIEGFTGLPGYFHVHSLHALGQIPAFSGSIPTLMNVPTHIAGQIGAMFIFTFWGWGLTSLGYLSSRRLLAVL